MIKIDQHKSKVFSNSQRSFWLNGIHFDTLEAVIQKKNQSRNSQKS